MNVSVEVLPSEASTHTSAAQFLLNVFGRAGGEPRGEKSAPDALKKKKTISGGAPDGSSPRASLEPG